MKTLLRGGSVVSGRGTARLDVLLEGERIADRKSTRLNSSHS